MISIIPSYLVILSKTKELLLKLKVYISPDLWKSTLKTDESFLASAHVLMAKLVCPTWAQSYKLKGTRSTHWRSGQLRIKKGKKAPIKRHLCMFQLEKLQV